jgi:hypothetical protein
VRCGFRERWRFCRRAERSSALRPCPTACRCNRSRSEEHAPEKNAVDSGRSPCGTTGPAPRGGSSVNHEEQRGVRTVAAIECSHESSPAGQSVLCCLAVFFPVRVPIRRGSCCGMYRSASGGGVEAFGGYGDGRTSSPSAIESGIDRLVRRCADGRRRVPHRHEGPNRPAKALPAHALYRSAYVPSRGAVFRVGTWLSWLGRIR